MKLSELQFGVEYQLTSNYYNMHRRKIIDVWKDFVTGEVYLSTEVTTGKNKGHRISVLVQWFIDRCLPVVDT